MRVISKARLKCFWEQPGQAESESPLRAWYTHVNSREVSWRNWASIKAAFAGASMVGNCVVFNLGGNNYRLVARVLYPRQKVFILKVMTHDEYDQDRWKEECGCYEPPPRPPKRPIDVEKQKQQKRRRS